MNQAAPEKFKNRTEAKKWLESVGVNVAQTTFNTACERLNMLQPDKSVTFVDVYAYVKRELKVDLVSGRSAAEPSPAELDRQRWRDEMEDRKLEAEVLAKEKANRKEDAQWIKREKSYEREGALVAQIMGEARFQLLKTAPALIATCKGDGRLRIEVEKMLEGTLFETFRTIYESGEIEVAFEDDDEELEKE